MGGGWGGRAVQLGAQQPGATGQGQERVQSRCCLKVLHDTFVFSWVLVKFLLKIPVSAPLRDEGNSIFCSVVFQSHSEGREVVWEPDPTVAPEDAHKRVPSFYLVLCPRRLSSLSLTPRHTALEVDSTPRPDTQILGVCGVSLMTE